MSLHKDPPAVPPHLKLPSLSGIGMPSLPFAPELFPGRCWWALGPMDQSFQGDLD